MSVSFAGGSYDGYDKSKVQMGMLPAASGLMMQIH